MKHFSDALFEDLVLNEGIWGYQTLTRTGNRNKPIYTLIYGQEVVAKYDKNTWEFAITSEWERHIDALIEWLGNYYPGFFIRKESPNSVSYTRFCPTRDEAIAYIKSKNIDKI